MSDPIPEAGNALTRKLGPLPVWAYGAIVAAIAWGLWYWRGHSASQVNPTAVTTVPPMNAGDISGANAPQPQVPYSGTISTFPLTPASPTTNAQWAKFVSDSMIALGYAPDNVNNALSAYVNGNQLDQTSKSLVDVALQKFGNAPEGILPVKAAPPAPAPAPAPTPAPPPPPAPAPPPPPPPAPAPAPPAPPAQRFYTVVPGDTLSGIAQRYTGSWANWPALYAANRGVIGGNPDLIFPGQRYVIPW